MRMRVSDTNNKTMTNKREPEFDPKMVRDISETVYRERLGEGGADRMIEKDADSGEQLRERAGSYDSLTRSYLRALSGHKGQ